MLDNAFGIFNNVSPRFQWAEIDLPFQSDDNFFRLPNYDAMLASSAKPIQRMKMRDAFLLLFSPPETADENLTVLRSGMLTALDMQMLIHRTSSPPSFPFPSFDLVLILSSLLHPPLDRNLLQPSRLAAINTHPHPPRALQNRDAQLEAPLGRNQVLGRRNRVEQVRFSENGGDLLCCCEGGCRGF
jgi:hypothetical protein